MAHETLVLEINGQPANDLYPALISLEVEADDELATMFRLRLAMALLADGSWKFLDDERLIVWNRVVIRAGFDGSVDELMTGYITHIQPHFAPEITDCVIEIWGMDGSVLLDREEKLLTWPDKSDSDIAQQIFGSYGMVGGEIEATSVVHQETVSTIIQRETDMQFLKRLALRNGYECFVEHDKGYFRPPKLDTPTQPLLAVQFGDETNVQQFSLSLNALTPTKVVAYQIDRVQKDILTVEVENGQQANLGSQDARDLSQNGTRMAQTSIKGNVTTSMTEMNTLAQAFYDEAAWFVTGGGQIVANKYGHVLQTRQPVTIKGIGETYSGIYYVTHVTHNFTPQGYNQFFRVKRNGVGLTGLENFTGDAGGLLGGLL